MVGMRARGAHLDGMAQPTITDRFPPLSLDELIARVRAFDGEGPSGKSETICRLVEAHAVLSYRWGGHWRYRRARRVTGEPRPTHVRDLIWREDVPAPIGRANAAGFRVLYLADRRDTALSEIRCDDDHVVLTEFRIRAGRSVLVAPVGEMAQVQRTGLGILTSEAADAITGMLNACDVDQARAMLITDAFLLKCLAQTDEEYALSSSVAMAILEKLPAVDAIVFPSRRQAGAVNFAVRADRVWDAWGVTAVQEARARHLALGYYRLSRARHVTGIRSSGELVWSPEDPEDMESTVVLDPPWHPNV
jgi:hypothetical protein